LPRDPYRHLYVHRTCLLLKVKQTRPCAPQMLAFDPKRTFSITTDNHEVMKE